MIADAVFNLLSTDPGVSGSIGARIYPSYGKQADKVYPLCVYEIENTTNHLTNDNSVSGETAEIHIAAISPRYSSTAALAKLIKDAMDGAKGTWAGVKIQGMFLKDGGEEDDTVTEPTTERILYYVKNLAFDVAYET